MVINAKRKFRHFSAVELCLPFPKKVKIYKAEEKPEILPQVNQLRRPEAL